MQDQHFGMVVYYMSMVSAYLAVAGNGDESSVHVLGVEGPTAVLPRHNVHTPDLSLGEITVTCNTGTIQSTTEITNYIENPN